MDARPALGRAGESAACDLYRRAGFTIVERNYRCSAGEIDVVARRGDTVVFCEVKTRMTERWGEPYEAVDHRKRARLRRLAAIWLGERRPGPVEVRFDIVSVIVRGARLQVAHMPDAF
ncbi:MAG: YraN family protein [Actinomycetota bacterium]